MATVDEILTRQAYAAGDETWTKDNNYPSYHLYVEPEYVPVTNKRIADFNDQVSVRGERNAQFVGFQLPRYDDGIDLTAAHLYIHYQTVYGGSDSVPCNVSKSDNYVRICWQVPAQATQEPDRVQMMIYATGTNSMGERVTWKTLPTSYTIHDGLDIGGGIPEPDPSWYEQFVAQMEAQVSTAQDHANDAQASKTAAAGSATAAAESATASAQALEDNRAYVQSQKETFVGYNRRETDSKYANALIGSASGTGQVTVGDAWEAPVTDMDVAGKSEQVATTGAQLLDLSAINKSVAGAVVNYADGGYSISGTGALTASFTTSYTLDYLKNQLKPGNLILKSELTIPKLYVRIWDGNTVLAEMQGNSTKQITQEMIDNDNVRVECFLYAAAGNTITPGTYHPMLYQDGDGTWEPYTGGKPSPSPDYPQPIISTGTVSTGAQLFDASKIPTKSAGGATVTNNGNGSFTISGDGTLTGTFKTYYRLSREEILKTFRPGIYTLSADVESYPKPGIAVRYIADNSLVVDFGLFGGVMNKTAEITQEMIDDESLYFELYFYGGSGTTIVPGTVSPMLNAGATAKPWEPYTGGKPSPSPEYPQTMDVTVTGAQLLDLGVVADISAGGATVITVDGDYTISGTGALTASIEKRYRTDMKKLLKPGNLILKSEITIPRLYVSVRNKSTELLSLYGNSTKQITQEMLDDENIYVEVMFFGSKGTVITPGTYYPMLYQDGDGTYQPYHSSTATIPLTEPLRGIGDYRDRVMCRDGVWGIERYISHYKLTSDIVSASSGGVTTTNNIIDNRYTVITCEAWKNIIKKELYENGKKTIGFCTIAPPGMINDWNTSKNGKENVYTINAAGAMYISIPISSLGITADATRAEVTAAVKQYVADNDVYVMFILDSPTWEPLPSATQSALNALTTYTGTTHVTITAGGPEPDVRLGYVQDTRAVIADLQAQINEIRNGGTT